MFPLLMSALKFTILSLVCIRNFKAEFSAKTSNLLLRRIFYTHRCLYILSLVFIHYAFKLYIICCSFLCLSLSPWSLQLFYSYLLFDRNMFSSWKLMEMRFDLYSTIIKVQFIIMQRGPYMNAPRRVSPLRSLLSNVVRNALLFHMS